MREITFNQRIDADLLETELRAAGVYRKGIFEPSRLWDSVTFHIMDGADVAPPPASAEDDERAGIADLQGQADILADEAEARVREVMAAHVPRRKRLLFTKAHTWGNLGPALETAEAALKPKDGRQSYRAESRGDEILLTVPVEANDAAISQVVNSHTPQAPKPKPDKSALLAEIRTRFSVMRAKKGATFPEWRDAVEANDEKILELLDALVNG